MLRLTIDDSGEVTKATVERGAGHGFDEAARQTALSFRFDPAKKNGEAVAAVILYEYRFELKTAEPPPGEQAKQRPATISVGVRIGRAPIAGAIVTLTGRDRQTVTRRSDSTGTARFQGLDAGKYRVSVEAPGFEPYSHDERAIAGRETRATYGLAPTAEGQDVVVRGEARRDVTVRRISGDELKLVPGTSGDPLRVLESMPGVTRAADGGGFIIRGSSPFFSGVFVDGMAIPFLYHIYDIASVVPADMVDEVSLYPGSYGVRYGRYIGGIVNVGLASPDTSCSGDYGRKTTRKGCYHGLLQFDLIEGRAMVEGPVADSKHWSFSVSARRSWLDFVIKQALKATDLVVTTAPRYRDGYAQVEYKKGKEKLSVRAYTSKDEIAILIPESVAEDVTTIGNLQFEYGFDRVQALYSTELDENVSYSSMLGAGRDYVSLRFGDIVIEQRSVPIAFRQEFQAALDPMLGLNMGLDLLTAPYDLTVKAQLTDSLTPVETIDVSSTDATFAAYAELPITPTDRATIVPGVRVDRTPLFDETTVSPRLLASYDLVKDPKAEHWRRTTLKGGVGRYYQAPPALLTGFGDGTRDHVSMRAMQYSVGVEQEVSKSLDFSVEGFYIDRDRLLPQDDGGKDDEGGDVDDTSSDGTGHSIGLEALVKVRARKRFFGWVAYTLSQTVERSSPDEPETRASSDQTHNLVALGSVEIGRGWRAGLRFKYTTGLPFTDIARPPRAQSLFDGATGDYTPQYTARNAERFPATHQLDARIDKTWQYKDWALTAYLDVRNTYNHRIVQSYAYNWDFTERQTTQGLPVLPNLGLKGEF